ncbi:MAG: C40 family peptidase [Bacteroidales bacterium]
MRVLHIFDIALVLLFLCSCRNSADLEAYVNNISSQYITDKALEVYNISVDNSGNIPILRGETTSETAYNALITTLDSVNVSCSDSIKLLKPLDEKGWGLITVSVANLRGRASHSSEMVSQTLLGTPVQIYKKKGSWLLVRTPDSLVSYVQSLNVRRLSEYEFEKWKKSDRYMYMSDYDVLKSVDGEAVMNILSGDIVAGEKYDNQLKISNMLPEKNTVALLAVDNLLSLRELQDKYQRVNIDEMCEQALSMLGRPYSWGGTSPVGLDCSGFMRVLFRNQGYLISRNTYQQAKAGQEVDASSWQNFKKGDLIFFGSSTEKKDRITHVGLYLGEGRVIHSSGYVRINSFKEDDELYSKRLLGRIMTARRYAGNENTNGITQILNHKWYN